ncbi:hypothetical protein JOQ06_010489 [Pogonophryne albipinna]|uniref:Rho family GTPase 2 n=1 Tax=Pogonophryne albipinna TaxID=1090488 RepID=A0AAD6AU11_9TELE|nr:hypothetical protein JOQ06_010489 [Pogonophryne albipinna]
MDSLGSRCKIVVVGDTQCGKTALLHVFAKDSYPENYVPTVFENYTASFEIEKHRIELNMWDTSETLVPAMSLGALCLHSYLCCAVHCAWLFPCSGRGQETVWGELEALVSHLTSDMPGQSHDEEGIFPQQQRPQSFRLTGNPPRELLLCEISAGPLPVPSETKPEAEPALISTLQTAPLTGSAAPEANAQSLSPPTSIGATTLSASVCNPSELSLGGFRVGCGVDSTMIGMCLDGYALEEVESIEQRMSFSTHKLFFHTPVAVASFSSCVSTTDTSINSSAAELRTDPWKVPIKGCTSSAGKAQGALINIPCGLTMKPFASFQVATILDQPNLKCFAFALKVNFKRKTAAGDIKDAGGLSFDFAKVLRSHPCCSEQKSCELLRCDKACRDRSSYYDNVRPLAYPDSDAVLICFDISRPETLDSVIKKWQGETQEFCPNAKVVLVGCKLDMRTDVSTLRELSKQCLIPVTHEQGSTIARQMGAVAYVECTSKVSENSVRDVFHITTVASVQRAHKPQLKRSSSRRGLKRVSQLPLPPLPGRTEQMDEAPTMRKDRAKSCVLM